MHHGRGGELVGLKHVLLMQSWKPPTILSVEIFSSVSTFSFPPKRKYVQKKSLVFFVSNANLYSKSRQIVQICVLVERKIWIHFRKSRRTEIVGGFRLRNIK